MVREPRKVLSEFGTIIPDDVSIYVHDSTADCRYIVLPMPPTYLYDDVNNLSNNNNNISSYDNSIANINNSNSISDTINTNTNNTTNINTPIKKYKIDTNEIETAAAAVIDIENMASRNMNTEASRINPIKMISELSIDELKKYITRDSMIGVRLL